MSVFQDLQSTLERGNASILKFLNPGLTRIQIEESLARFKYPIPEAFFSLYEWHNGTNYSESHYVREQLLFDTYLFPSLNRVKELYNETATDKYIKLSHLPVFEEMGGPMLLLECNEKSKQFGMLLEYDIESADYDTIITKYDSITSLLQTVIERSLKHVKDIKNEDDFLETTKIAKELNPKSKYWKLV